MSSDRFIKNNTLHGNFHPQIENIKFDMRGGVGGGGKGKKG